MNGNAKWQTRTKDALARYFQKRSLTRVTLGFLCTLTGSIGFLLSSGMLHLGVTEMWIRYPVAVIGAYGAFLGMIRVWVEFERARFDPDSVEIQDALRDGHTQREETRTYHLAKESSWSKWLDALDIPFEMADAEGCLGGIALVAAIGVIVALVSVLVSCLVNIPTLLADGFLDTFLVVGLYRRLRIAAKEHWLGTTIRKTWTTAFAVAVILGIAGAVLQGFYPEEHSIGPVIKQILFSAN